MGIGRHCMKKILGIVTLLLMILGCGSGTGKLPVRDASQLTSHMGSSTVALVFTTEDGDVLPFCSGVWISDVEILTAGHCAAAIAEKTQGGGIEGLDIDPVDVPVHYIVQDEVTSVGKEPTAIHLSKVVSYDKDHDLALLKALGKTIPSHDHTNVVSEMPALGEHVYIVGHPKGMYWSFVEGVISQYHDKLPRDHGEGPYVQISAPVWFGNSGGGAFDSRGDLVGIASFITRAPNTSFFVHPDAINKFLKSVKEREEKRKDINLLK
jgi:hypothetical protein